MTERREGTREQAEEILIDNDERRENAEAAGLTTADMAHPSSGGSQRPDRTREAGTREPLGPADSPGEAVTDTPPLLPPDQIQAARGTWATVQAGFVDEPRRSVKEADQLVAQLMQQLAEGFAREREQLESRWDQGDDVSTEDLRVVLQRYRSFFNRLLAA